MEIQEVLIFEATGHSKKSAKKGVNFKGIQRLCPHIYQQVVNHMIQDTTEKNPKYHALKRICKKLNMP